MRELTEEERRPQVVCEWADSGVAMVRLLGEHDLASAPAVTQTMQTLARCCESVVVDLSETVFIDCTIIHRLIEADANLASRGQGFALQIGTEPIVAKALELCGVRKRLGNAPTREEAVEIARRSAVSEASALHSVSSTDGFSSGGAGSARHCGGSRDNS
jgi:anti-anti-sigma factor